MDDHIIVGYDGSAASAAAANWAATEAALRHTSLTIVGCYVIPPVVDFGLTGPAVIAEDSEALRTATRTSIDTIVTSLRTAHPRSPSREWRSTAAQGVSCRGTQSTPDCSWSERQAQVKPRHGCSAPWPMCWRARLRAQSRSSLWSGPSEAMEARTARELWWASTSQRDQRGARVGDRRGGSAPRRVDDRPRLVVPVWASIRRPPRCATSCASTPAVHWIGPWSEPTRVAGRMLTAGSSRERPPEAIIEAADGADLIVVGSRGRGGFRSLLLGSVSSAVIHHASCPTVVVRESR